MAVYSENLKMDGVTWKVIKKFGFLGILITIVGYNLNLLNSHALHILNFIEHPTLDGPKGPNR